MRANGICQYENRRCPSTGCDCQGVRCSILKLNLDSFTRNAADLVRILDWAHGDPSFTRELVRRCVTRNLRNPSDHINAATVENVMAEMRKETD